MKNKKRERALALACCAAMAALMLLFTSQCSPLYPINVWGDANCLLTVGRVMKRGGVLYRDIYEQKGPLLYLIHAAAACLSDTSFSGVYLMEIPALTAALYAAYRLMRLRAGSAFALGAAAVFGALATTGGSFMRGDSAEEFCLPLLTAALAIAYAEYGRRAKPMRTKRLLVCGALAGCVAAIKYTLLGAMVGLCRRFGAPGRRRPPGAEKRGRVSLRHGDSDSAVDGLFRGKRRAFRRVHGIFV